MTSNLQISGKSASGIIFVVGGDNFDDFYQNLLAVQGGDPALTTATIAHAAQLVTPVGVSVQPAPQQAQQQYPQTDAQAIANVQQGFPNAQVVPIQQAPSYAQPDQRQSAGTPPGQQAPYCPNHNQPAKWVPGGVSKSTGRPYNGFWACSVSQQGDRSCRIAR